MTATRSENLASARSHLFNAARSFAKTLFVRDKSSPLFPVGTSYSSGDDLCLSYEHCELIRRADEFAVADAETCPGLIVSRGECEDVLQHLVDEATQTATEKGWTDHTPGESFALMHSEISEGLEDYRDGRPLGEIRYRESDQKPEGVIVELADVVIRIFHFAGRHKLPLARAIREKMDYNRTRPVRHGGKLI